MMICVRRTIFIFVFCAQLCAVGSSARATTLARMSLYQMSGEGEADCPREVRGKFHGLGRRRNLDIHVFPGRRNVARYSARPDHRAPAWW